MVEKAVADWQTPLDIAEESLLQREKRTGIDQVHDEVERLLSKVTPILQEIHTRHAAISAWLILYSTRLSISLFHFYIRLSKFSI